MQQLLNNRTASLSETEMENVKDLWSKEIDKNQRQAFYRYWLRKYVHLFGGIISLSKTFLSHV
jgi:hypothetical protein